ncbi:MAG: exodeoxyribonuclease VII large subunit, partial [Desulfosalsimonas sp.]
FNSEEVARAIFASEIPVISAVGHETDYTIADFAADMRAPTPSAAAELAVPVKREVSYTLQTLLRRMHGSLSRQITDRRKAAEKLSRRLVHPKRRLDELRIRIDDDAARLSNAMHRLIALRRERLAWRSQRLFAAPLRSRVHSLYDRHSHLFARLRAAALGLLHKKRSALESAYGRMYALSPAAVLDRGYSITRTLPDGLVITDAAAAETGDKVEVILSKGTLTCSIERIYQDGQGKEKL